jgi:hypothetical protein
MFHLQEFTRILRSRFTPEDSYNILTFNYLHITRYFFSGRMEAQIIYAMMHRKGTMAMASP